MSGALVFVSAPRPDLDEVGVPVVSFLCDLSFLAAFCGFIKIFPGPGLGFVCRYAFPFVARAGELPGPGAVADFSPVGVSLGEELIDLSQL